LKEGNMPNHEGVEDIVRERSKAGRLVAVEKLLQKMKPEDPAPTDGRVTVLPSKPMIESVTRQNKDIETVCDKSGKAFYYSSLFMSEPYARILLRKQEGAAGLIAGTVREDSDRYPRPTPLEIFKEHPFGLSEEEILSCIQEMSHLEEFQDIRQISSSIGRVFLYSSKYLDRNYALMLAEWVDVGQFENP
jgi:hypothetical protein